jgi:predicted polyphosphate/ATP-dependent NAD kinase
VDLVIFSGGDGTARDIYDVIGQDIPILGIPAGVKMHSSVFAVSPTAAQSIIINFCKGKTTLVETEIMDIDEQAFRQNLLQTKLYGYALTPYIATLVQSGKSVYSGLSDQRAKDDIARFIAPLCTEGIIILGGGGTVKKIAEELGINKCLLGVDILQNGRLVAHDVTENEILACLDGHPGRIIISPTGQQGFVFGRGNQQISPEIIRKIGSHNIIIVSTPHKMSHTPYLFVDTGDSILDQQLSGMTRVITGFGMAARKEIRCGY